MKIPFNENNSVIKDMNKRIENLRHSWEKPLAHLIPTELNFLFALLKCQIAFLKFIQVLFIYSLVHFFFVGSS